MMLLWVRGKGFVHVMLDGEGSRQSNQSLRILVTTFRMILEKDTNPSRVPSTPPAELPRTSWTRKQGDRWRWLENVRRAGLPPNSSTTLQVPTKCPPSPSFTAPTERAAAEFHILNPLGYVERLWDLCCTGVTEQNFTQFPDREETLWITVMSSLSQTVLCVVLMTSCHASCVWEWVYGWQKRMKRRLTKD